jgi:predicted dehydrogenase
MINVKIYGAGSIGNHLAYACRSKGWNVLICDVDTEALERTKSEIYPSRYGAWDDNIRMAGIDDYKDAIYDLIIIGTPPDTHMSIAIEVLKKAPPKVLLIEKPLCTPSLDDCEKLLLLAKSTGTFVAVAYNHTLTKNTQIAAEILNKGIVGSPFTISARFREHWGSIFRAHPWLNGPQDTYLGFFDRGGGASGEHSHAINIWQHFAHLVNMGRIIEVSAMLDVIDDGKTHYDRICQLSVKTESGLIGNIVQDVITEPAQKNIRVQGEDGFVEWYVNYDNNNDALIYGDYKSSVRKEFIPKKRTDDFIREIDHIEDVLEDKDIESPISLERGLDTMMVIAAAHISNKLGRTVKINYKEGYSLESIKTV